MVRHSTPLLLVLAAALATACGSNHTVTAAEMYQGRWNYDLPDAATMTNIAIMNIGDGVRGPQIGDIVFTAAGPDRIVGRTDVGCTWQFAVTATGLALASPGQTCYNPTAGYAYTMTEWTVHVSGGHETESIKAVSHHEDRDYEFDLSRGARTRAAEDDPKAAKAFQGTWAYGAPDLGSGANTRLAAGGAPKPLTGAVSITPDYDDRVTAHTDDGCDWTLVARGDTAKLDPPAQTCTLANAAVTLSYWTIVTDGHRQLSAMYGTDLTGTRFSASGDLLRR
ncbi:hypothetical protein GPX89_37200 [Nocardia sp. ET3-3]|uniref:Lipoprotein n=1 Tax=Nocardia terrae TaxID=2675851 RepID=A0A7K1V880_9NOCA|nr:hypothetical protein [Nocardia terrae]MVU82860.1 hypothetical protein [Nocardia terrae]